MRQIYLIGFMGTGKSSVSRALGKRTGNLVLDLDAEIVKKAGKSIPEIFADEGEESFRELETEVLRTYAYSSPAIIACGGGTILKDENIEIMKETGVIILLTATPATVLKRVAHDKNRPLLQGKKSIEGITELMDARLPRYEKAADISIATDDLTTKQIASEILRRI